MGSCASNSPSETQLNKKINDELKHDKRISRNILDILMVGSYDSLAIDFYTNWKDLDSKNDDNQRNTINQENKLLLVYGYINEINYGSIYNAPNEIYRLISTFIGDHILVNINKIEKYKYELHDTNIELIYFPLDMNGQLKHTVTLFDYVNTLVYVSNVSLFDNWINEDNNITSLHWDIDFFKTFINKRRLFRGHPQILCFTGYKDFKYKIKNNEYNFSEFGINTEDGSRKYRYNDEYAIKIIECIYKMYSDAVFKSYNLDWHIVSVNDRDNVSKIRFDIHHSALMSLLSRGS